MSRSLTVFCFCILSLLFFVSVSTEQVRPSEFSVEKAALHISATFLLAFGGIAYCGFAAIHAIQHVADPSDRAVWLIIIVAFTAIGSIFYLLTKYQHFREIGKGSLIQGRKKMHLSEFWRLTKDEEAKTI